MDVITFMNKVLKLFLSKRVVLRRIKKLLQKPDMVNDFGRFHKDFSTISTSTFAGYETRCRKTSIIVKITARRTRAVLKQVNVWRSEIIYVLVQSRLKVASHLCGHNKYRSLAGRWGEMRTSH